MNKEERLLFIRARCAELLNYSSSHTGPIEAGWKATISVIDKALDCQSYDEYMHTMYVRQDAGEILDEIIIAWKGII